MGASLRALVLVAVAAGVLAVPPPANAGGGGCTEVTEGTGTTVEFLYACITPTILRAEVGDQVTFVNRDDFRHIIVAAGVAWSSDGYMAAGETVTTRFRTDGVFPYQCYLHPGMAGAVVVGSGTGPGAAERRGVVVAAPDEPEPEIVYLTRPPEVRTVTRTSGSAPLIAGIGIGVAVAALAALGARFALRRRGPLPES